MGQTMPVTPARMHGPGVWVVGVLVAFAALVLGGLLWAVGAYNGLVAADQKVQAQWAQVENAYQRRMDLIPNLVETVKGAADFERTTLTEVTEARSKVSQLPPKAVREILQDPEAFARFEQAQDQLSSTLTRLLAVAEAYPALGATASFRELQAQLEGSENRISVERMRFNEAARDFNTARNRFPTVMVARVFGRRFEEKNFPTRGPAPRRRPRCASRGGACWRASPRCGCWRWRARRRRRPAG